MLPNIDYSELPRAAQRLMARSQTDEAVTLPRRSFLQVDRESPHTLIFYESPYRLPAFLEDALAVYGDREAAIVEAAHGDLETVALVADSVGLRHLDISHEDRADVTRPDTEAILDRFGPQALAASSASEHEGGDPAVRGLRISLCEHQ